MKHEFVDYPLALRMKALDYDDPCMAYYNKSKKLHFDKYTTSHWSSTCLAPTWQSAFRWFREKYNVHAEITWSPSYEYEPRKWSDAIYEITFVYVSYTKEWKAESPDMQRGNGKQLTYEEAELACLEKLIEIVEQKTNK
jgi:hypothetical protein